MTPLKQIYEYNQGKEGPIILWIMYPHIENICEHTKECICELCKDEAFTLLALQVEDWNGQLSPWKNEQLDDTFSGQAAVTRDYICKEYIPNIKTIYDAKRPIYIMGYSLAGLFSLWMLCEDDIFAGALCCSGSLWYPDFDEYLKANKPKDKNIYLSLGGKESNSKDALMASVGEKTKRALEILKTENKVIFEQNPGGHFADSGKRLAKAVRWCIDR